MASISSTSSLGNTALRGFGGMASGIDRDSIIEKMTLGTTTKINNQKKKVTELQWKQAAYRNISDKIIDWADTYASYSSSKNLKDFNVFAKNQISIRGAESSTRFVSATGTSSMVNNVSLLGVKQLATSTVQKSDAYFSTGGLKTEINDLNKIVRSSNLQGRDLSFSIYNDGKLESSATFTFAGSYKDENGKTVTIDYLTKDLNALTGQLNSLLETSDATVGGVALNKVVKFSYSGDQIVLEKLADAPSGIKLEGSDALKFLGAGSGQLDGDGKIAFDSDIKMDNTFEDAAVKEETMLDFLTGKKVTFNYDGSNKTIELITAKDAKALKELSVAGAGYTDTDGKLSAALNTLIGKSDLTGVTMDDLNQAFNAINGQPGLSVTEREELRMTITDAKAALGKAQQNMMLTGDPKISIDSLDPSKKEDLEKYKNLGGLQGRLNQAFGTGTVVAKFDTTSNKLSFDTANETSTVSIMANDGELLKNMGVSYGASNKVNLNGTLDQSAFDRLGDIDVRENGELDLEINGVAISGLTKNSSINDILSKINSSGAGVKATYVESTGEFMLVSSETGKGREINLKDGLTKALFGSDKADNKIEGKNAEILVSYGGVNVFMERSSNTFDLEGLNVTVSGTFGNVQYNKDEKKWESDTAEAITFSAKADVEGALEKVKSFIEDYNALITEINNQVRTRPDSNYGALTDEQKAEMDETSIENWEKKAKEGILYGDATMRDLSVDVQSVFTKMMNNGASYEDLKAIGITYSEDWGDGGTLVFDESQFKTAMENDPEKVANIFTGGRNVEKGLIDTIDETFTPYATRYGSKNDNGNGKGSYGRLVEIAGSEKKPTTLLENEIYKQLKEMQETIDSLNERLKMEQDRYISQFTTMESLLNQMNTQSSYLSQLTA